MNQPRARIPERNPSSRNYNLAPAYPRGHRRIMNYSPSLGWVSAERIKIQIEYMLLFNELEQMSVWHIGWYDNYPNGFVCFYGYARIFIFENPKEQNVIGVLSWNTEQLRLFGTFPKLLLPPCENEGCSLVCQSNMDSHHSLSHLLTHCWGCYVGT